jgi:alkylhydroperoxidase family enzyme
MGHAEMILAVAGMSADEVAQKTRRLAGGGGLSDAERTAVAFTRKQAKEPWAVTDEDVRALEKALGREKAWQVIWWASRCHYMTKVADAFQLPLEKDNPFRAMPGAKKEK